MKKTKNKTLIVWKEHSWLKSMLWHLQPGHEMDFSTGLRSTLWFSHVTHLGSWFWTTPEQLEVIDLLEGEPPSQSQVYCRLEQLLCKDYLVFWPVTQSLLIIHNYNMMLAPPCFTEGILFSGWWEVLGFCSKGTNLIFFGSHHVGEFLSSCIRVYESRTGLLGNSKLGFIWLTTPALSPGLWNFQAFGCPVNSFSHLTCGYLQPL